MNPLPSVFDYYTTVNSLPSAVLLDNVHSLVVDNLLIRQSHGYGLVMHNCFQDIVIRNSHFDNNYWIDFYATSSPGTGGNTLLFYDTTSREYTDIKVVNSSFSRGLNLREYYRLYIGIPDEVYTGSGGLNILIMIGGDQKVHYAFDVSVTNCNFISNTGNYGGHMNVLYDGHNLVRLAFSIQNSSFVNGTASKKGGGLYFHTLKSDESSYIFVNSSFTKNVATDGGGACIEMTGLTSNIIIMVVESEFSENKARSDGGGLYVYYEEKNEAEGRTYNSSKYVVLTLMDSKFNSNTAVRNGGHGYIELHAVTDLPCIETTLSYCLFQKGKAVRGGAIIIDIGGVGYCSNTIIDHSNFYQNDAYYGGAIHVKHLTRRYTVQLKYCKLQRNFAYYGAGICVNLPHTIECQLCPNDYGTNIYLNETHIAYNTADMVSGIYFHGTLPADILIVEKSHFYNNVITHLQYSSAVMYLERVNTTWVINSTFSNNLGSCIRLSSLNITLQGNVFFHNNTAYAGAALQLDCPLDSLEPSFLVLLPNTTVTITNNTALYYGGGLAVNPVCHYNNACFFQAPSAVNTVVDLHENKALISANSIYGPPVTQCVSQLGGDAAFTAIFKEDGYSLDQVVFSFDNSICFCGYDTLKELICNTELKVSVWPGEEFNISAMVTGELNDTSTSFIRAALTNISASQFGNRNLQEIQELRRSCDELTYSVTSAEKAQIKLQIDSAKNAPPSFISIIIRKCPLGFQLSIDQDLCVCSDFFKLQIPEITCDIVRGNPEIIIPGRTWVGNYSGRLAVHRHCPLDYCSPEPHSVDLQRQHLQCTSNHSGVLCGGCQTGLSLSLGTARCLDNCSNYYLLLVFPFALAGVAIVFILLKCNLNVSLDCQLSHFLC